MSTMSTGISAMAVIGVIIVLGILGGIIYAVTKGSGKGSGHDE